MSPHLGKAALHVPAKCRVASSLLKKVYKGSTYDCSGFGMAGPAAVVATDEPNEIEEVPTKKKARTSRGIPRKRAVKVTPVTTAVPVGDITQARQSLLEWFDTSHRILPWRSITASRVESAADARSKNAASLGENVFAYRVWVSEVMLQQTQVATVIDYFTKWVAKWGSVDALAQASEEEVKAMWSGLGYYRRASFLLAGARHIMYHCGGRLPRTAVELAAVPGIGPYTSAAIASIAFGERAAAVDGNVMRVMSRLRMIRGSVKDAAFKAGVQTAADAFVPEDRPGDWNQAVMELGAAVCRPTNPACEACALASVCVARRAEQRAGAHAVAVTDFPAKAEKAKKREEEEVACVVYVQCATEGGSEGGTCEGVSEAVAPAQLRRLLLVRRPTKGLLAGMWECPSAAVALGSGVAAQREGVLARLRDLPLPERARRVAVPRGAGKVAHIFSHINRTMHVFGLDIVLSVSELAELERALSMDNGSRLVTPADMEELGISTLTRKVIAAVSAKASGIKRFLT